MRESVIDVLFYLFDDVLQDSMPIQPDIAELSRRLEVAGFQPEDIERAMAWFVDLSALRSDEPLKSGAVASLRVFAPVETRYIDAAGQNYLTGLLRRGIIGNAVLEQVVDRALALGEPVDEYTLRWVTAMVVLNAYGELSIAKELGLEDADYTGKVEWIH